MAKYLVYKKHSKEGVRTFTKKSPAIAFIKRVRKANPKYAKMGIIVIVKKKKR